MLLTLCVAVLMQPVAAIASWQSNGTKASTITATSVFRPDAPSAVQSGSVVRLTWSPTMLRNGQAVEGYEVRRRVDGGAPVVVCTAVTPTLTCDDVAPAPPSVITYAVVATYKSWRSQESPQTTYNPDPTKPVTTSVTVKPGPSGGTPPRTMNGYITELPLEVTLTATDAIGVANVRYRVNGGAWVVVSGDTTVIPVDAQGDTVIDYFATDVWGNAETVKSQMLRVDTIAPDAPTGLTLGVDSGTSSTDRITDVAANSVSGYAEPGSTVEVYRGTTLVRQAVAGPTGVFSVPVTLVAGGNELKARAIDAAGNASVNSPNLDVTLVTFLTTAYMKTNAAGDTTSSTPLPLSVLAPTLATLFNYDTNRDSSPGLIIKKGSGSLNETDDTKIQRWNFPTTRPTVLEGNATVRLWSAMKDFEGTKKGSVVVGLFDCDSSGGVCTQVGQTSTVEPNPPWAQGSSTWVVKAWSLGAVSRTIAAGRVLQIRVVVGSAAGDDMKFAYDATGYASSLTVQ